MNWPVKKLGDLTFITTGKLDANASDIDGAYPFFTCAMKPLLINKFAFDCEAVLIAGNGDLNVKYYEGKFNAYQRTYVIQSKDKSKLSVRFLFHFLDRYVLKLREMSIGGVIKYIKLPYLTDAEIPLPPFAEQERIAALLDTADRILKQRESGIAKLDSLIYSFFNQYFLIGNQWNSVKLIDVANTTSGGTPKRDMQNYYGGDICWVKSGELNRDLITETEEHLTKDGMNNSSAKLMPEGTVLLAMYGATIGAVSMLGVRATTNQAICCINVDSKVLVPEYLMYFLKFNKNKIINMAVGGAQPNINQNIVRNIEIPIPLMQKQLDFLKILNFIKKTKDVQKKSSKSLASLNLSLQHQSFAVN